MRCTGNWDDACMTQQKRRTEGLTPGAGEMIGWEGHTLPSILGGEDL